MADALETFIKAAADHGRCTLQGTARSTNAAYERLHRARQAMRSDGSQGETALLKLLRHPDESVRVWAAMYLLPSNEAGALATLDEIATAIGPVALSARMTATEWRAGRLQVT